VTSSGSAETILVVDDDPSIRTYLTDVLTPHGYECQSFEDSLSALRWLSAAQTPPDLLLSDITMPGMSGLDLLRTVKAVAPNLPVILLSGLCDLSSATDALRAGATDYLVKPASPADILKMVSRNLDRSRETQFQAVRAALSRVLSSRLLSSGKNADQLLPVFDLLGIKRFETMQHSRRVASYSLLIGRHMTLTDFELEALEIGSLLHDVGKAGIPYNILMKPGKLDPDEWRIMEMHPTLGAELLSGIPDMKLETEIVYSHHERFDGKGYPEGLAGQQIPLGARVFAVADTLDAITSDRCYRKGQNITVARTEVQRMSGSQFDPRVVEHFQSVPNGAFDEIRILYPD
jgi:response regulator RpfG family c-di-GMP phosphodiesterase